MAIWKIEKTPPVVDLRPVVVLRPVDVDPLICLLLKNPVADLRPVDADLRPVDVALRPVVVDRPLVVEEGGPPKNQFARS